MPRFTFLTVVALAALAVGLAACGGAASQVPDGPTGAAPTAGSAGETDVPGSVEGGDGESFPAACSVLTASDWEAVLGNPVDKGAPNGTFVCDWGSDPEQSSGSLLLQPGVTRDLCVSANSAVEIPGFDQPGVWLYDTAGNIPGGSLVLCVEPGFVSVVVTGGIGAEDDEAAYRSQAEEIMKVVLSRL